MKTSLFSISLKRGKTTLKPWNRVALFFYHVPLDLPLVWFNDRSGSPECPSVSRQPWHRDERWNGDCDWCNYAASDWRRGQIITGLIGLCLDWAYATLWLKCCRKVCVCVCVLVSWQALNSGKRKSTCLTFQQDSSSVCCSFSMALSITLTSYINTRTVPKCLLTTRFMQRFCFRRSQSCNSP